MVDHEWNEHRHKADGGEGVHWIELEEKEEKCNESGLCKVAGRFSLSELFLGRRVFLWESVGFHKIDLIEVDLL